MSKFEIGEIVVIPITLAMLTTFVGIVMLYHIRRAWLSKGLSERQLLHAVFTNAESDATPLCIRARRWILITVGAFLAWGMMGFAWFYGY